MKEITKKRLQELAARSYEQNIFTFTSFLTLSEQEIFFEEERELQYAKPVLSGGTEDAERRILRFGDPDSLGYDESFPIVGLLLEPLIPKFSDPLTHRDFLGALMHLGIERELIGDILVRNHSALVFCLSRISDFICENLDRVRHTSIRAAKVTEIPEDFRPRFESRRLTVSSPRLDGIVAAVWHLSRSASIELFRMQKVAVQGRICENNSVHPAEGSVVSVRGHGKLRIDEIGGTTAKGRTVVHVSVYC